MALLIPLLLEANNEDKRFGWIKDKLIGNQITMSSTNGSSIRTYKFINDNEVVIFRELYMGDDEWDLDEFTMEWYLDKDNNLVFINSGGAEQKLILYEDYKSKSKYFASFIEIPGMENPTFYSLDSISKIENSKISKINFKGAMKCRMLYTTELEIIDGVVTKFSNTVLSTAKRTYSDWEIDQDKTNLEKLIIHVKAINRIANQFEYFIFDFQNYSAKMIDFEGFALNDQCEKKLQL